MYLLLNTVLQSTQLVLILIERFKDSNLPIYTIEELQQLAFDLVGKPQDIPVSDKDEDIIAIVEYRDGSIIDVVRKPL